MPPVIAFIGWHNSGKTTLTRQVVAHLKARGHAVGVIKSTKECGIAFDRPGTDTALYKQAGADGVALLAPDQLILQGSPPDGDLRILASALFPDVSIVVAEGFKHAAQVPKIEVRRDKDSPLLRELVEGVVAVATDLPLIEGLCFGLDQSDAIADFIESTLLRGRAATEERLTLSLNDRDLPVPEPVRQRLEALIEPFLPPGGRATLAWHGPCPPPSQE